jgi:hypothetical protein
MHITTLTQLLREAENHHGPYEATAPKHHWSACTRHTSSLATTGAPRRRPPATRGRISHTQTQGAMSA